MDNGIDVLVKGGGKGQDKHKKTNQRFFELSVNLKK
jgi:hypothetical protein